MSGPRTLCVDVGGTAVKAAVLDATAHLVSERARIPTPYTLEPSRLVGLVRRVADELGRPDRLSLGFPGVVRDGRVLTAPLFVTTAGPGSTRADELATAWDGFDLRAALEDAVGRPARVGNDGDVHGAGAAAGEGLELTVTLGTGVGTGLVLDGRLCPHLELAHHPFRGDATYNEQLGDAERRRIGDRAWSERVHLALAQLHGLLHHDRTWLGGGNARHVTGELPADAAIVGGDAGLVGGVRLWQEHVAVGPAA